jgi:hypothetical protein
MFARKWFVDGEKLRGNGGVLSFKQEIVHRLLFMCLFKAAAHLSLFTGKFGHIWKQPRNAELLGIG